MGRITLVNHYSTVEEFIAKIVDDAYEVFPDHFIAKTQANHLQIAKENFSENELIILLDFAENYSFVVQDPVQGFHWENSQGTLHPFFASSKGDLKHTSICVISDCLKHDQTQGLTITIKSTYVIMKAIRFSRGTLQWFRSYLSGRIFLVNIESKLSDFGNSSCRVPQGSILGPLLF